MTYCIIVTLLTLDLPGAHDDLVQGAAQPGQPGHPGPGVSRGQHQAQAEQADQGPHDGRCEHSAGCQ